MKNEWYEIAVSYTDEGGTETIESKYDLEDALKFAENTNVINDDDIDFIFIDKWYAHGEEKQSFEDYAFKTIRFNKNQEEEVWLYPNDLGEDLIINIFDGNQINIYSLPENWRKLSKITSIHNLMIEKQ